MRLHKIKLQTLALLGFILLSLSGMQSKAQAVNQSQRNFKRGAATVIFASLGGGILGLSTLSFYGRPQEHTDNITTGVVLGLIGGVAYVFSENNSQSRTEVREIWIPEKENLKKQTRQSAMALPVLTMNFSF